MLGTPKEMRQLAKKLQQIAQYQEIASMSPEELQKKLMKKQEAKLKSQMRKKVNKLIKSML